jgi:hypothetical protein
MNWQSALRVVHQTFQDAGLFYAIGGSAMLCLRGIATDARDLDLFVRFDDAAQAAVILCSISEQIKLPFKAEYRTAHFSHYRMGDVEIDLMADFAVATDWGVVAYPSSVLTVEEIPFDSIVVPCMPAEDWLFLYEVLGRSQRVLQLESHFTRHPANQVRLNRLLELPMPQTAVNRLKKQWVIESA